MLFIADLPQYDYGDKGKSKEEIIEGDELEDVEDFENFLG